MGQRSSSLRLPAIVLLHTRSTAPPTSDRIHRTSQLLVTQLSGERADPRSGRRHTSRAIPGILQWLDDSLYVLDQRDQHRLLVLDWSGSVRDTLAVADTPDQLLAVTPDAPGLVLRPPHSK